MLKKLYSVLFLNIIFFSFAYSQELNARVTVIADQIPINYDRRIFVKLQNELMQWLNNKKWTNDDFELTERIECSFVINLEAVDNNNNYTASINVQAQRPVYNTDKMVSLLNITDREFVFQYIEGQLIDFNDARVVINNNALQSNLMAVLAFYTYIILGIDYDSFALGGGKTHFKKAINIISNAPENALISGWQSHQGRRNRYWIADLFINITYDEIHSMIYDLYRKGFDMLEKTEKAQQSILIVLNDLAILAQRQISNLSILPVFMQGKVDDLSLAFKDTNRDTKNKLLRAVNQVDPININRYRKLLD